MTILYQTAIYLYSIAIRVAAVFGNEKAGLFISGRRKIFKRIAEKLNPDEKRIWFHVASLGEFEQGRPVMEKLKEQFPEYKIFLTFFSPSGYEIRKNYQGVDYIFYLPLDTPSNARKFIELVQPKMVYFIKYEYWYFYLKKLNKKGIPICLCSAIFRPEQIFFKWYGGWYRNVLFRFTHLFVQTPDSEGLLHSIDVANITVTGDTRFDRVYSIAMGAREIKEIDAFTQGKPCLIAGSTWEPDDQILCKYINETTNLSKTIIAPHEIGKAHIEYIESLLKKPCIRYSQWKDTLNGNYDVLIIDNIGMLSSLYRYGQVAYIGGGFGKGIHNILEAATYGLPVIFGPNYKKFREAVDLIKEQGAYTINNYTELRDTLDKLLTNRDYLGISGNIAKNFVQKNIGATDTIIKYSEQFLSIKNNL